MSHLELKRLQHVTFWQKNFFVLSDFWILERIIFWNDEKYKVLDFELKLLQSVTFSTEKFLAFQILDWRNYKVSEFKLKLLQRVKFCIEKQTSHQFLTSNFFDWSQFKEVCKQKTTFHSSTPKNNKFCFCQAS